VCACRTNRPLIWLFFGDLLYLILTHRNVISDNSGFLKHRKQQQKLNKRTKNTKKGTTMAKRMSEKGKVLEDRHLLDLAADTGKNGDELDELMTLSVSRNEVKTLCEILREIGDSGSWLRLCLSIRLEYLSEPEKIWKEMNLFSIAYTDDCFDDWVTVRVLRGNLFFPLYFLSLQIFSRGQLSPEVSNECVDVFKTSGWQEAIRHAERELGLNSFEIFDRILKQDGRKASAANVFDDRIGS
jgi:hypothetical protein